MAYVGSYSSSGGAGLAVANVDSATGTLTVGSVVPGVPDASWLATSHDGRFLYTTNEEDPTGSVTALDRSSLAVLNKQSTQGDAPTHLSVHPSGRYLLTANYGSGSVAVLPLAANGHVEPLTDLVQHTGSSGSQPHAHQIITDPTGQWVLAVDLGNDSVYVYQLQNGTLRQHQQLVVATGTGPRHLVFHPTGTHAYLVCEDKSQVIVCTWDATRGVLTPGQIIGTVEPGAVTPNFPAEGVVSPDGRFLYVTNRGDDSIATFAVTGTTLTLLNTSPCGGDWPRHATLDPTGRHLYVSNQRSGTVTWLPRDPASGKLSPVAGQAAATAVAMVLFA
ncbi:MAG TPA: lactonase family protein [Pseudonocardiaceae bacterium]|jgi:6-phosphogluconolactonase (cycloisomerase 2 family)|nr:lactonase family protein [Pseudonocardiaceae bacterium]